MSIIRTGIMKKHKKSPEALLSDLMHNKISGIGLIADIIEVVIAIVKKLIKIFGKKPADGAADISANDAPAADDFGNMSSEEKTALSSAVKTQGETAGSDNSANIPIDASDPSAMTSGGKKTWSSL